MRFWGIRDFDTLKAIFKDKIDDGNFKPDDDIKPEDTKSKIIKVDFKKSSPVENDKKAKS